MSKLTYPPLLLNLLTAFLSTDNISGRRTRVIAIPRHGRMEQQSVCPSKCTAAAPHLFGPFLPRAVFAPNWTGLDAKTIT